MGTTGNNLSTAPEAGQLVRVDHVTCGFQTRTCSTPLPFHNHPISLTACSGEWKHMENMGLTLIDHNY